MSWIFIYLKYIKFDIITFCWEWQGLTNNGYARVKKQYLHRLFFEYWKGKIPQEFVIDHLCRNPICLNPSHMEAVTIGENVRRGVRKDNQLFCINGHPYNLENTLFFNGRKQKKKCKICTNVPRRKSYVVD